MTIDHYAIGAGCAFVAGSRSRPDDVGRGGDDLSLVMRAFRALERVSGDDLSDRVSKSVVLCQTRNGHRGSVRPLQLKHLRVSLPKALRQ